MMFLLLFFPISLLIFYLLGRFQVNAAKFWLVVLSFLFYGWWNPKFLFLLIVSVIFNYIFGYFILTNLERPKITCFILTMGIAGNLAVLFYYKYLMTLMDWFQKNGLYHGDAWGSVVLPLGISFFTFTQIGFLVDAKGGIVEEKGFLEYVLFVTFFPHLIAGPILHHREIMPQFAKKETYLLNWKNIGVGIGIFIIGLTKKVLIADRLAPWAAAVFAHPGESHQAESWIGALSYSLQLYFDFSGYSEMALGIARTFNVLFPANFDSPYKSKNIIDYWQRWHISLTRYITLYLYNPVSLWIMRKRAAKGFALLRGEETTFGGFFNMLVVPTFYTMILAGIWHGAGLQFLIFGLLHGFYLCVNHAWRLFGPKKAFSNRWLSWIDIAWKVLLTYLSVLIAFIFFRAKTASDAWLLIKSMLGMGMEKVGAISAIGEGNKLIFLLGLFVFVLVMPNVLQLFEKEGASLTKIKSAPSLISLTWQPTAQWGFLFGVFVVLDLLFVNGTSVFLYFQF
jgi:alginate O-acetyltransferase complex protein AlgI